MVNVLAFDTAGAACSAAVLHAGVLSARRFAAMARGQAETLMPMIAAVLEEAEMAVAALDVIAVTVGPGAFTGLRIGLAAARGLALASGVPVLGISSFAAVAAQAAPASMAGRTLVVALDSKRREFYLQAFAGEAPLGEGALVAPEDVPAWLPAAPLLLAGDAAPALARLIAGRCEVLLAGGSGLADAADVARLAAARWRPGMRPPPPRPLYLRPPDTTAPRAKAASRQVRPVQAADLPALAELHALCFPEERWDVKALSELLAMAGASGHLVEDTAERRPLGFILDLILAADAEILTLAVAPERRRQGIARALLADLLERARSAGARGVGLEVAADNPAARRLYESCGFALSGQRRGYYRRGAGTIDALILRRALLP